MQTHAQRPWRRQCGFSPETHFHDENCHPNSRGGLYSCPIQYGQPVVLVLVDVVPLPAQVRAVLLKLDFFAQVPVFEIITLITPGMTLPGSFNVGGRPDGGLQCWCAQCLARGGGALFVGRKRMLGRLQNKHSHCPDGNSPHWLPQGPVPRARKQTSANIEKPAAASPTLKTPPAKSFPQ